MVHTPARSETPAPRVRLVNIAPDAAERMRAGELPEGVPVADDYPTEFSAGVAEGALRGQRLGPYFIHAPQEDLVVGEIGGDITGPGELEIGYAIVASRQNRGHATAALAALVELAAKDPELDTLVGHTPKDRPNSARVLEKAGFVLVGEVADEHDGEVLEVQRWELDLASRR